MAGRGLRCGVLALQGDFAEHLAVLSGLGVPGIEVRKSEELGGLDALIIPGGESTTMLKLLDRFSIRDPLVSRIEEGMGVFGTCAGGIVLATRSTDGEKPLGVLDAGVVRNAFGRQVDSFECDLDVEGIGEVRGVFIRAPVFDTVGKEVEVLAIHRGHPVLLRAGKVVASAFHPEVTGDPRLHTWFLEEVCGEAG